MFTAWSRPRNSGLELRISWLFLVCLVPLAPAIARAEGLDSSLAQLWTTGSPGQDDSKAVTTDSAGFVYATGSFSGTVDFDPGSDQHRVVSQGATDIWITKHDAMGGLIWARSLGGPGDQSGRSIRVDRDGNILILARYKGTLHANPGSGANSVSGTGHLIVKLNSNGDYIWSQIIATQSVNALAIDATGNVYLTGWFTKTVTLFASAGSPVLKSQGGLDAFVLKLDSHGNFLWARALGGRGVDRGQGISIASSGIVYVTGYFQGTVDFDPGPHRADLTSMGPEGLFVAAFTPAGALVWAKAFDRDTGASGPAVGLGVGGAEDRAHILTGNGRFLTTLGPDGGVVWMAPLDGAAHALAVDSSGAIHAAANADTGALLVTVGSDRLSGWSWDLRGAVEGSGHEVRINDIAAGPEGVLYAAGAYRGAVNFAPGLEGYTRTSAGGDDLFVAAFRPVVSDLDPFLDSDGDGMTDAFELLHGFDPFNPADGGATDTDGNGLTNAEESALADRFPVDPRDALLPRRDWHVSAADGDDSRSPLDGGGTPSHPWRSIGAAHAYLEGLARSHFPVRILLDDTPNTVEPGLGPVALYEEWVEMAAYTTLEGRAAASERVVIRPPGDSSTPVVRGAHQSHLRHVQILAPAAGSAPAILIEVQGVAMGIEGVTLDGSAAPGSIGVLISGVGSSASRIRGCRFWNLGAGLHAIGSGVAVSDSQFDGIAYRAIAIDAEPGAALPNLGNRESIRESGFNRFRNLAHDARAIYFVHAPESVVSAEYNDWGVYTAGAIEALIEQPGAQHSLSAVNFARFIEEDQTLLEGAITGVVLDAHTLLPVSIRYRPKVTATTKGLAATPDEYSGVFVFPQFENGAHALNCTANGFRESTEVFVEVATGRIPIATRILLVREQGAVFTRLDVNGDGLVNAVDVQLVINAALGFTLRHASDGLDDADVNEDGRVNAVDVQLVINGALGLESAF